MPAEPISRIERLREALRERAITYDKRYPSIAITICELCGAQADGALQDVPHEPDCVLFEAQDAG